MSVIRFGGFRGEIPRIHPRLLPEGGAQTAKNCRVDSGALESIRGLDFEANTTETDPISLYRYSPTVWLEATTDVDWVPYPVVDDQYGRVIFTDAAIDEVRVTDATIVGTGGYPSGWRLLEVPAPVQGFAATLNGTADDDTEIPETRFYVCTFVNEWGAEGPPSPASNQIEWRSGQTVTLSSLSSVPSGNYNITHRRIYRINTGSTGVTNYQFVSEVAVTQTLLTISDITQTNPPIITTTAAHGLTDGQEVVFAGLGVDATTQPIVDITKENPAIVTITGHGLATGQEVLLTGLGGGNGMDELNNTRQTIFLINNDKFSLDGVDSTAYTTYAGGGSAALVYGMDELNGNQYFVAVKDTDEFTLESVDATGFESYSEGGTVSQLAGNSYTDAVASESLGEVLPTDLYDPPNPATKGIKLHPAGFLVGYFGKTLAFAEPGAPHAWPIDYRLVTGHDIVGIGIFGNTVMVSTKGWPYLAVGSDPAAMSLIELEVEQACIAKRGIVDLGTAVVYPSPDGLIMASNQGVQNITSGIFRRDQWQALVPSSIIGFNWEQQYLGFYDNGVTQRAFIIDPFAADFGVRYVDREVLGGYKDIEEDLLYLLTSASTIAKWDESSSKIPYEWKSKPVYTPRPVNMAAAKIISDDYPVAIEFWVDDVRRFTRVVGSINAFRLPGGFRGEKFEVVIEGTNRVSEVAMATTMNELSVTV
jgi:hypothetical protein